MCGGGGGAHLTLQCYIYVMRVNVIAGEGPAAGSAIIAGQDTILHA